MRKHKNNEKDDKIRPSKTPSPTTFEPLKSPRLLNRDTGFGQSSKQMLRTPNSKTERQKIPSLALKTNNTLDSKNRENSEGINKLKKLSKGKSNDYGKYQNGDFSSPYQSYFDFDSGLSKQTKSKNISNRSISRRNSSSSEKVETHDSDIGWSFEQRIRKLVNQNIQLKQDIKMMKQKVEEEVSENNQNDGIVNNEELLKKQLAELLYEKQLTDKQSNLLQTQIQSLKTLLQNSEAELNQTHYQIYQMKQEIFHLSLDNQRLNKSIQINTLQSAQSLPIQKSTAPILSQTERKLLSQTSIENKPVCNKCKTNSKTIAELVSLVQNLRFQLHNKTNSISTLCSEVQRIQGQLKLLDKPRQMYKKFNAIIDGINKDVVLTQAKQLNEKYKREMRK